ncbi:unnamed protein product [Dicrocoelium dendriticum]|nr:unnamed protein product [Dicrocoelium dendriticum]
MSSLLFISFLLTTSCVFGRNVHAVTHRDLRELFERFKHKYSKAYLNVTDEEKRYGIFRDNLLRIEELQKHEKDTAKYGITKFTDLTTEEFSARFTNAHFNKMTRELKIAKRVELPEALPSFDWREKGAVTPVEDQGSCGSCWAFSVAGNIEGQYYLNGGNLTSLSKQQLIDCDQLDDGCASGYPFQTYGEVIRMGGMVSAVDYPYLGGESQCRLNVSQILVKLGGALFLPTDEKYQAKYLQQHGPLSVGLDAKLLQFYQNGIFNPPASRCSSYHLNHAVLTVGFGKEKGIPFWIVKNSWGSDWGEDGYFRIRRGRGTCGINQVVTTSFI